MWSQIQLPFFALGLWVCSWETKHICKQIFCNVAGEKGNLEATADIFTFSPEYEKLRCPLLKWQTVSPCCHMRFQFMAFPGTLKQGIDSLVLPVCCAALLHPKGKMMFLKTGLVMQWHPAVTMWVVQSLLRSKTLSDADFLRKPWLGSSVEGGASHSSTRRWEGEGVTVVYTGR